MLERRVKSLEDDMRGIKQTLGDLQKSAARIETAILGDVDGWMGIRQKADHAYDSVLVLDREFPVLKKALDEKRVEEAKRQGRLIGFGAVVGGVAVKAWTWLSK